MPESNPRNIKGRNGVSRKLVPPERVDRFVQCSLDNCPHCGSSNLKLKDLVEILQQPELPEIKAIVTEYILLRVNSASDKMDACFIDIKVTGRLHKLRAHSLTGQFYNKCIKKGVKCHSRASFGFYHPNFLVIEINGVKNSTTIRLNPGVNPNVNKLILVFLRVLTAYN